MKRTIGALSVLLLLGVVVSCVQPASPSTPLSTGSSTGSSGGTVYEVLNVEEGTTDKEIFTMNNGRWECTYQGRLTDGTYTLQGNELTMTFKDPMYDIRGVFTVSKSEGNTVLTKKSGDTQVFISYIFLTSTTEDGRNGIVRLKPVKK